MKNLFCFYLLFAFTISCSKSKSSHIEVAQIVVESFYQKDNSKLEKYTTEESYQSFLQIQDLMTANEIKPSNFSVIKETNDGSTAWVKFTTSYEEKPETFKLINVGGTWKVTERKLREKAPF